MVLPAFLLVGAAMLLGCGAAVKAPTSDPTQIQAEAELTILTSDEVSAESSQVLRLELLADLADADKGEAIRALASRLEESSEGADLSLVNALAELAMLEAREAEEQNPQQALAFYLCAASHTFGALTDLVTERTSRVGRFDPEPLFTAELYNASLARVVALLERRPITGTSRSIQGPTRQYSLRWNLDPDFPWLPAEYELRPVDELDVSGFYNHYRVHGLGAPVVARLRDMPERASAKGGISHSYERYFGLTAFLKASPGEPGHPMDVALHLFEPQQQTVGVAGVPVSLSADFTAFLAFGIGDANPEQYGEPGMFRPEAYLDLVGLYLLEPFREDKIPLVFVHGLGATVGTFAQMTNDILGDPELRDRYQLWFFNFPSGLTFGTASVLLRRSLEEARSLFDPDNDNPNMDRMVVLGHSMGGLMTRLLITTDRSGLYDVFFTAPLEDLSLEAEDERLMREVYEVEALDYIHRVVFMATPHGGSPMASGFIGIGGSLISSTPDEMVALLNRIVDANPEYVTEAAKSWRSESIKALRPGNPLLEALRRSPMDPDVTIHSIVGHGKRGKPGPGSSDGVVPYESSHLDEAVSEISVARNHIVHDHPEAIAEVKRILKEHLKSVQFQSK